MPRVGRRLGTTLLIAIVAVAGLFAFAPREPLDLDSYLRDREAVVGGITPGTEKRILWAGAAGARTDWAVVYLHGFSATSEEIRPVPDRVAAGLGANLYFTRLAGYGLATAVLTWPFARHWVTYLAGREQCFKTMSEGHARFWTTCYPTEAPVPMVALAGHAAAADYSGVTVPALFLFAEADQGTSPAATRTVAEGWGGPVAVLPQGVGAGDDPHSHVIAGDIRSPSMTAPVTQAILDWAGAL